MKKSDDSEDYKKKRSLYGGMLTLYGRNAVKEALLHPGTRPYRLHLATSNRESGVIKEIKDLALEQRAEICYHDRKALSRISKNQKQDQGVAVDLICEGFSDYRSFHAPDEPFELIAVDRISNPVNLGMIIRTVSASPLSGIIIPRKGSAKLDALVVKASAGNLFKARIYMCEDLSTSLAYFKMHYGCLISGLTADADQPISTLGAGIKESRIFILANESYGLDESIAQLCDEKIAIPMANQVDSLNVAVAAGIVAFHSVLGKT